MDIRKIKKLIDWLKSRNFRIGNYRGEESVRIQRGGVQVAPIRKWWLRPAVAATATAQYQMLFPPKQPRLWHLVIL